MNTISRPQLNPGTWWILGLALAMSASLASEAISMVAICALAVALIYLLRGPSDWSMSLNFYLGLALLVVITRVIFRIIFSFPDSVSPALFEIPAISIELIPGISSTFFGKVTAASLYSALTDGFRLAAIILSVAMANTLANPRKLLKSTPTALYEIATAVVVAINLAPQLISSLLRVQKARAVRGRSRGLSSLAGTVVPALEDTIDSSLALAASMESRGFGRTGTQSKTQIWWGRSASFLALAAMILGIFLLLSASHFTLAAPLCFAVALLGTYASIRLRSKNGIRTRYQAAKFIGADYTVIVVAGIILALALAGVF